MARPLSLFADFTLVTPLCRFAVGIVGIAILGVFRVHSLPAQSLDLKRALSTSAAPGCATSAGSRQAAGRRDNAEARRLAAAGQEAALIGDQKAARDAFARAAALNPGDDRIAYDLARANEELADTLAAVVEYCRYLTLSPDGREAADVRARLPRLVPLDAVRSAEQVQIMFRRGIVLYDGKRFDAAAAAFDTVVRDAPDAIEGTFNRGLARAAMGRRADALKDLETYVAAAPASEDRATVVRTIDALRRPVYSPGVAVVRSVLPGFGQLYTGRPVRGIAVLGLVTGATVLALHQTTGERRVEYTDPNGQPAPYTERVTQRKYFAAGIGAATGLAIAAAFEASWYARRSRRGAAQQTGARETRLDNLAVRSLAIDSRQIALRVSARF